MRTKRVALVQQERGLTMETVGKAAQVQSCLKSQVGLYSYNIPGIEFRAIGYSWEYFWILLRQMPYSEKSSQISATEC